MDPALPLAIIAVLGGLGGPLIGLLAAKRATDAARNEKSEASAQVLADQYVKDLRAATERLEARIVVLEERIAERDARLTKLEDDKDLCTARIVKLEEDNAALVETIRRMDTEIVTLKSLLATEQDKPKKGENGGLTGASMVANSPVISGKAEVVGAVVEALEEGKKKIAP